MPFQPGQSGNLAGKPKGSKHGIKFDVAKILTEIEFVNKHGELQKGFNPFEELAILAATSTKDTVRCDALAELCAYIAPKLKHIEHAADSQNPFTVVLNMGTKKE